MSLSKVREESKFGLSLPRRFVRSMLGTAAVGLGLFGLSSPASGQQTWTQPTTGASGTWSTSTWSPSVPTSGLTTALTLDTFANSLAYTFTNDIGTSSFILNSITLNTGSTNALTVAAGTNGLTFDGTSPGLIVNGPGPVTFSGPVTLNQTTSFTGGGNGVLTVSAVIAPGTTTNGINSGITINQTGFGVVSLTGANTFGSTSTSGVPVILTSGGLSLGNAAALGATTNTLTINGGFLQFSAASTISNNIVANSSLVVAGGATGSTSTATLTGIISGSGGITLQSYNTTGGLTLQGANTYAGATTLLPFIPSSASITSGPTLTLSGLNGSITSTGTITIGRGATLQLTNATGADNNTRIPSSDPINVVNGKLGFTGITGDIASLGNVTAAGVLGISSGTPTGTPTLNLGTLTRIDNAAIILGSNYIGTTGSTGVGTIGSAAVGTLVTFSNYATALPLVSAGTQTQIGIIPFAASGSYTNATGMVTYLTTSSGNTPAGSLQSIAISNPNYFTQFNATNLNNNGTSLLAATNQNVGLGAGTFDLGGGSVTVNALGFTTPNGGSIIQNGTVTVYSGAVVNYNQIVWNTGGILNFGSTTGYVNASYYEYFTSTSSITGSGGVVFYGFGGNGTTHTVSFQNTTGNPFTGGLWVNGSVYVGFTADNQLGAAGGAITLAGGSLAYNSLASLNITRPITIDQGNGGFTFNFTSTGATAGAATSSTVLTLSGGITGGGAFIKEGGTPAVPIGIINLAGNNSYAGGTVITDGILQFTTDNNLGAGSTTITMNGGTLQPLAMVTLTRPFQINASYTTSTVPTFLVNFPLTLQGTLTTVGQLYGTANPTISVSGTSSLTLLGNNTNLSGNLTISSGASVIVGGASGSLGQIENITVPSGATFTLSNVLGYNSNRIGSFSNLTLSSGFANYIGGSTASNAIAQQYGALTISGNNSVFSVTAGTASPTVIDFNSLTVSSGTLTFRGDNLGGSTGDYTRILINSYTTNLAVIPGVYFSSTSGTTTSTTPAGYNTTLGVVQLTPIPTSGNLIDNITTTNPTSVGAAYTTTGNTIANTGASVYSLTLTGVSLTLNADYAAQSGNSYTANGTLNISGGILTSQGGLNSIIVGTATSPTVDFGPAAATITTTTALSIASGISLTGSNGLTKAGASTLTINGTYSITGPLTVSAGTLSFPNSETVGTLSGSGTLSVGAGATLTVNQTGSSTFSGTFSDTSTTALVKTGSGSLTFAPTNTPLLGGGTTISNGTLVLGSSGAATAVLANFSLGDAVANTSGILDLSGNSPAAAITAFTFNGTGTGHQIINSNTTTASTINLNLSASITAPLTFGGNLIINKNDSTTLVLTGTVLPAATTQGVFYVNAGTLQLNQGSQGLGSGMSVNVASGATFQVGYSGTSTTASITGNVNNPFGTITLNNGTWINTGTNYFDQYFGTVIFTNGGTVALSAGGTSYFEIQPGSAGIQTLASSNPAYFGSGLTPGTNPSGSEVFNNTGASLPINVAAGSVPSGIDLDFKLLMYGGGTSFTKTGAGVLQLSTTGITWAAIINGGTVQLNGSTPSTAVISGSITVNSTGVLRGDVSLFSGPVTVNSGGTIQAGSIANPVGNLYGTGNVTINPNGILSTFVSRTGTGTANSSLLTLSGASNVLNLNPGSGTFTVNLISDSANPVQPGETYTLTLVSAGAGNLELNGTALVASQIIPTSSYTITTNFAGVVSGYSLGVDASGANLVLSFTPVPEPACLLLIGGAALMGVRIRRNRGQGSGVRG